MLRVYSRRALFQAAGATCILPSIVGCGTILYPERRGQPATRVDWTVVALDGLLLLLFLVPGVVAFVVDFTTGAIYLPMGTAAVPAPAGTTVAQSKYRKIEVPKDKLNEEGIASAVSRHLRKPFQLRPNEYETRTLQTLDEFEPTSREYASLIG